MSADTNGDPTPGTPDTRWTRAKKKVKSAASGFVRMIKRVAKKTFRGSKTAAQATGKGIVRLLGGIGLTVFGIVRFLATVIVTAVVLIASLIVLVAFAVVAFVGVTLYKVIDLFDHYVVGTFAWLFMADRPGFAQYLEGRYRSKSDDGVSMWTTVAEKVAEKFPTTLDEVEEMDDSIDIPVTTEVVNDGPNPPYPAFLNGRRPSMSENDDNWTDEQREEIRQYWNKYREVHKRHPLSAREMAVLDSSRFEEIRLLMNSIETTGSGINYEVDEDGLVTINGAHVDDGVFDWNTARFLTDQFRHMLFECMCALRDDADSAKTRGYLAGRAEALLIFETHKEELISQTGRDKLFSMAWTQKYKQYQAKYPNNTFRKGFYDQVEELADSAAVLGITPVS